MSSPRPIIRSVMTGTQVIGWTLLLLGASAALAPQFTGAAIVVTVGLILLAAGALVAVFGWRAREAGRGNLGLVIGAVTALCGLVLALQPGAGLWLVRAVLIAYFLISGASEIGLAWTLRGEKEWGWLLLGGLVSVLAAAMLWSNWPITGARAIGLVVGAKLASIGWAIMRLHGRLEAVGARAAQVRARLR